jgi:hypothetical protein
MDHEKKNPKSQKAIKTYTMDKKVTTMDHEKTDLKSQKGTRGCTQWTKKLLTSRICR